MIISPVPDIAQNVAQDVIQGVQYAVPDIVHSTAQFVV